MTTVIDGIDYGPLAVLVGNWKGDTGKDVAPLPDGEEVHPYYETILFEAIGDVDNAERQNLSVLRYHQVVMRKSNDEVFHNETGYITWDKATGLITQSLSIPRALSLLAGGEAKVDGDKTILEFKAVAGAEDFGIVQAPFMLENAKSVEFRHRIMVKGDRLSYHETTVLEIYGKQFDHTDANTLVRE